MPEEVVQIKRYPNRRYYARSESKYVSLPEIEAMVQAGQTVEIRDSQSGEDLTRVVLTQIIMERQPDKMKLFPTDMLHFVLRSNEVTADFLRDYFRHSLTYLRYLQQHSATATTFVRPMHWVKAWLDGIASGTAEVQQAETAEVPTRQPPSDGEDTTDEAVQLARRVELLEQRLRELEAKEE